MLVLFDIDGTLLLSRGASLRNYRIAAAELFGRELHADGMRTAGGLDPLIWRALCGVNGIGAEEAEARHAAFRAAYARHLGRELSAGGVAYALPGVPALLDALAARADVTLGLLTGNYPETGRLKLEAAGLPSARFPVAAWGVDGGHRRDLVPVALTRCEQVIGRAPPPEEVVIIGDTPHDVDCALAHGCRALGVATGGSDADELHAAGAHHVLSDLSDTPAVLACLGARP
jgi:phosphoglycolate phosphatase-like HAD superfamily hydrolase